MRINTNEGRRQAMKKNANTMVIRKLLEAVRKVAADNGGLPSLMGMFEPEVPEAVKRGPEEKR